jgi:hypothetical protein
MALPSVTAAVVGGSAFGALVIGSLSSANRLAPPEACAGDLQLFRVLGCSIVLAVLCALSAAGVSGRGRGGRAGAGIGAR